jgi:hypothetical protein
MAFAEGSEGALSLDFDIRWETGVILERDAGAKAPETFGAYAALKGRSSTAMRTVVWFFAKDERQRR